MSTFVCAVNRFKNLVWSNSLQPKSGVLFVCLFVIVALSVVVFATSTRFKRFYTNTLSLFAADMILILDWQMCTTFTHPHTPTFDSVRPPILQPLCILAP